MHWSFKYLGHPWTEGDDCYFWFSTIQREVFGRDTPFVNGTQEQKASALINERMQHWKKTSLEQAKEGDAVLMQQSGRVSLHHHIGVWTDANDGGVLHAPQGGTVQIDTLASLKMMGWIVREIYTHA